ncbi:MAG: hypothetical protein JWQ14_3279 [Adhaeribacter sp.]|nr:hypothetical protein [Adhaeribacter sp.]
MSGLINYIINNIEIKSLTRQKAQEVTFYINVLMEQETNVEEIIKLSKIKNDVLGHLVLLEEELLQQQHSKYNYYTVKKLTSVNRLKRGLTYSPKK